MNEKKVLLIDDDEDYRLVISRIFESAGAQVILAGDGMDGISKVLSHRPDLIILDVLMPEKDGFQVCQVIRQMTNTPLVMLSSLEQDQLMLRGLESGADDFLTKPVSPEILLARVRAVMRRSEQSNGYQTAFDYDDGRLKIDFEKHRVLINGEQIRLTPVEFRLLAYMVDNPGMALSFERILFNVWGSEYRGNDEYVHVYISHLRSKIEEDAKNPRYILSVHGVGYIFEKQEFEISSDGL